ncbi:MAG TPA: biotin/lipoyl-binding protein [Chloroflexi bacterium]|nr:biotin/lipoyl-binding protein [Chloroflexota bacterium]
MTRKTLTVTVNGKEYHVEVQDMRADPLEIVVDGTAYSVSVTEEGATAAPTSAPAQPAAQPARPKPQPQAPAATPSSGGSGEVRSPMPGVILDIAVHPGDEVKKGDALCALEAMKMKSAIRAPKDGVVSKVAVQNGAKVNHNDLLMVIS